MLPPLLAAAVQLLLDLRPNEEHAKAWIVKPQTTVAVQAAPDMSEHEVGGGAGILRRRLAAQPAAWAAFPRPPAPALPPQANTTAVVLVNSGMAHLEGGWPKEVDHTEAEQVVRWRRKVEKDEDYIKQVVRLGAVVEELVKQNNAIDIYETYFEGGWGDWAGRCEGARSCWPLRCGLAAPDSWCVACAWQPGMQQRR